MSCKWVEFVTHLYIGRWIVFINDETSKKIVMMSLSCIAEAAKSPMHVLLSIRAHAAEYVSCYILANVKTLAERRKGCR
jgi:hypothetical protein